MNFYHVMHYEAEPKYPFISDILGSRYSKYCKFCRGAYPICDGDLEVRLLENQGRYWPDCIAAIPGPTIILSDKALGAWESDTLVQIPRYNVKILPPIPSRLRSSSRQQPVYYRVEASDVAGAQLDFPASGLPFHGNCKVCGRATDDQEATQKLLGSKSFPYVFIKDSWNGSDFFSASGILFCTERIVDSSRRHQLTNFRFTPIEKGYKASKSDAIQYL